MTSDFVLFQDRFDPITHYIQVVLNRYYNINVRSYRLIELSRDIPYYPRSQSYNISITVRRVNPVLKKDKIRRHHLLHYHTIVGYDYFKNAGFPRLCAIPFEDLMCQVRRHLDESSKQ